MDSRITIAVTPRESFARSEAALESLLETVPDARLVYVDGNSPPRVARYLRERSRSAGFELIRRERYLTQNEGRNIAMRHIGACDFVLFVDNDIVFRAGWLERLVRCADETGAGVAVPLICIGEPAFERIHFYSGVAEIERTGSGGRLRIEHPHAGSRVADVASELRRVRCSMVESHCMLVRTDLLKRLGDFDEGLLSANDHVDLSLLAGAAGATLWVEPESVVNQLLPETLPRGWSDLPFFFLRWSDAWNRPSIEHFRAKWDIAADDAALAEDYRWISNRWKHVFVPLVAPLTRHLRPHARRLRPVLRRYVEQARGAWKRGHRVNLRE
ncbi:MAG: hypothetical protein NVS2B3_16950 [Vulcanimicrobiaceae bacterium]